MNERTKSLDSLHINSSDEETHSAMDPEIPDIKEYCTWCCASYDEIDLIEEITAEYHENMKKLGITLRNRFRKPGCTRCALLDGSFTLHEYLDEYFGSNHDSKEDIGENLNQCLGDKSTDLCLDGNMDANSNVKPIDHNVDKNLESVAFKKESFSVPSKGPDLLLNVPPNDSTDFFKKGENDQSGNSVNKEKNDLNKIKVILKDNKMKICANSRDEEKASMLNDKGKKMTRNKDQNDPKNLRKNDKSNKKVLNKIISLYSIPKYISSLPKDDAYISHIVNIYDKQGSYDINSNYKSDSALNKNTSAERLRVFDFLNQSKATENILKHEDTKHSGGLQSKGLVRDIEDIVNTKDVENHLSIHNIELGKKHDNISEEVDIKITPSVELHLVGSEPNIATDSLPIFEENDLKIKIFPVRAIDDDLFNYRDSIGKGDSMETTIGKSKKKAMKGEFFDSVCLEKYGFKSVNGQNNKKDDFNKTCIHNVAITNEKDMKSHNKTGHVTATNLRENAKDDLTQDMIKAQDLIKNVVIRDDLKEDIRENEEFQEKEGVYEDIHKNFSKINENEQYRVVQNCMSSSSMDTSIVRYNMPSTNFYSKDFFENIYFLNKPSMKINRYKVHTNEKVVKTGEEVNYKKLKGKDLRFEILEEAEKRLNNEKDTYNKIVIDKNPVVFIDGSYRLADLKGILLGQLKKRGKNGCYKENWFCLKGDKLTCFNGKENRFVPDNSIGPLIIPPCENNSENYMYNSMNNYLNTYPYNSSSLNIANNLLTRGIDDNMFDAGTVLISPTHPGSYLTKKYTISLKECRLYLVKNRYNFFCTKIDEELIDITEFSVKNVTNDDKVFNIVLKNQIAEIQVDLPILEFALCSHGIYYYFRPNGITSFLKWMLTIYYRMGKTNLTFR